MSTGQAANGLILAVMVLAVSILMIASVWKVFTKAGQPGWAAIVPIYNLIVMLQIAGKPVWWLILFFIPVVNLVVAVMMVVALARSFGKGTGFGIGLLLLSFVFYPILGFGDARYVGHAA